MRLRFSASYDSVRRFLRSFERQTEIPFRRGECIPGLEPQVDLGLEAWLLVHGKNRPDDFWNLVPCASLEGICGCHGQET
ncbi:MAG TPA: hypothetical protein DCM86_05965 [Verrucomicrobiales bacterium]|nr:hypothetical protein [Verrucomicrobiales bacterium]